jgi:hypothetical protein
MNRRLFQLLVLSLAAGSLAIAFDPAEPDSFSAIACSELSQAGLSREALLRSTAKRLISRDVINGRLALRNAAALFRELDQLPPTVGYPELGDFGPFLPAAPWSRDEHLCRQVVFYGLEGLADEPEWTNEEAAARLESELKEALSSPDGIRLPNVAALPPLSELLERAAAAVMEGRRAIAGGTTPSPDL